MRMKKFRLVLIARTRNSAKKETRNSAWVRKRRPLRSPSQAMETTRNRPSCPGACRLSATLSQTPLRTSQLYRIEGFKGSPLPARRQALGALLLPQPLCRGKTRDKVKLNTISKIIL